MLTVEQYAKHFDLAFLAPNATEAEVRSACQTAAKYKVNSVNVNSTWIEVVKQELAGTGVGPSAVIGFPYGACVSKVKYLELEEMVKAGCTACDMVVNIGALKDKNYALVTGEVKRFVEICGTGCDSKLIFEVGFLSDEDIAALTKICCEQGVTYVKTATGSQAFPDIKEVMIMKNNLSGKTKIKVSGVPRTFALPATLYLFDHLGVSLVGTRSAGTLVQQYTEYLEQLKK
ncbi:MAG: deoxyribose-phosphate aldolase [Treponema sp.]|jgi:deoxyribose-phosphate aldolase|nr:deoxyribose-phosphate aldolase [Treponema sp.]